MGHPVDVGAQVNVVPLGLELLAACPAPHAVRVLVLGRDQMVVVLGRGHEVLKLDRDLAAGQAPVPQVVLLLGREPLPACPARLSMCCSYIILHNTTILLGTTITVTVMRSKHIRAFNAVP